MPENIFISHHGKDDKDVQALKEKLIDLGCDVRNSSVDSTKHTDEKRPADSTIKKDLSSRIEWAGSVICLIGDKTAERTWVNYELEEAVKQNKKIIGIFKYGCTDADTPDLFEENGYQLLSWTSIDKLKNIIENGEVFPFENPDATNRIPRYERPSINC